MPTEEIIEYDLATLGEMTTNQLLIQVIARKDLERPKREGNLKAKMAKAVLDAKVTELIQEFSKLSLPTVAQSIFDTYNTVFDGFECEALL